MCVHTYIFSIHRPIKIDLLKAVVESKNLEDRSRRIALSSLGYTLNLAWCGL